MCVPHKGKDAKGKRHGNHPFHQKIMPLIGMVVTPSHEIQEKNSTYQ